MSLSRPQSNERLLFPPGNLDGVPDLNPDPWFIGARRMKGDPAALRPERKPRSGEIRDDPILLGPVTLFGLLLQLLDLERDQDQHNVKLFSASY